MLNYSRSHVAPNPNTLKYNLDGSYKLLLLLLKYQMNCYISLRRAACQVTEE